jgi:transposase
VIPGGVRIFVCLEPVDMRRGFDRLVQTARERGGDDATQGGVLVVFANRRATRLKLLWVERNGVCVLYKRLHRARFELTLAGAGAVSVHINGAQLAKLLAGVDREAPCTGKRPS